MKKTLIALLWIALWITHYCLVRQYCLCGYAQWRNSDRFITVVTGAIPVAVLADLLALVPDVMDACPAPQQYRNRWTLD